MADERENAWHEEANRLKQVVTEIRRQLRALGADLEQRQSEMVEFRRNMFDSLHSSVSSADEVVEMGQYMQEHWQQSLLYNRSQEVTRRLQTLLPRPYFGRVDFREQGAGASEATDAPETFYIGVQSLVGQQDEEWVYDWRTPLANLYYDFEPGPAQYRLGEDTCAGEITCKRQYQIEGTQLKSWFDSEVTVQDDILCELLGKRADGPMRSIVATIAREQNRAIRLDASRVLAVQGTAGSGKTSVAMQRVAYLLYHHRGHMRADQIVVLAPNALFADYVRHVLPELGEENVWQMTFDRYARHWIPDAVQIESPVQWWESLYTADDELVAQSLRRARQWKGTLAYRAAVLRFAEYLSQGGITFVDIDYKGMRVLSGQEQLRVFLDVQSWTPLAERLDNVWRHAQKTLQQVEAQRQRQLLAHFVAQNRYLGEVPELRAQATAKAAREVADIAARIKAQPAFDPHLLYTSWYQDRDLFLAHTVDTNLCEQEREAVRVATLLRLQQGRIGREDLAGVMTLWQRINRAHIRSDIRHLIVDEAQDYTPAEMATIADLFVRARVTLLGDRGQTIGQETCDPGELARTVYPAEDVQALSLDKSYRSTSQIRQLALALGGHDASGSGLMRDGEAVLLYRCSSDRLVCTMIEDVRHLVSRGYKSVAIITRTVQDSAWLSAQLTDALPMQWVHTGEETFHTGIVVTAAFLSKGLEFDAVLITGSEQYRKPEDRPLLYVACTRALHCLHIFESAAPGEPGCPWWDDVDTKLYEKVTLT